MPNPNRGNRARDAEKLALAYVEVWLADRGVVVDQSDGHAPDFSIEYRDERRAIGEVGMHEDPVLAAMWREVFKREHHHVMVLTAGAGQWGVRLQAGAHISRLYKELPRLVDDLLAAGRSFFEVVDDWPRDGFADRLRVLGIDYLSRASESGPDRAIFLFGGSGGVVPDDPSVIVDWLEGVLGSDAYADSWGKLVPLDADERHVFIVAGSATDFGATHLLMHVDENLPSRPPRLPDGITHLWCTGTWGRAGAIVWNGLKWSHVALPGGDLGLAAT